MCRDVLGQSPTPYEMSSSEDWIEDRGSRGMLLLTRVADENRISSGYSVCWFPYQRG